MLARLTRWVNSTVGRFGKTAAVLSVVTATAVFVPFRSLLGREQWGWPYLLIVGFIAGTAGTGPAVISAGLSFLAWNFFFFPPYHTLRVAESGDILHLTAFLIVAVAVGTQTGRLREREERALKEESRTAALYDVSSRLVADTSAETMAEMVDQQAREVADVQGARLWIPGGEGALVPVRGSTLPVPTIEEEQRIAHDCWGADVTTETCGDNPDEVVLPLHASAGAEGLLQVIADRRLDAGDLTFLESIAHLVAAYLESHRMGDLAMRTAADREAERLRTALISSVSHELKTPLASLTASMTDLLERGDEASPAQIRKTLGSITADLDRLDRAIGNLLDLSRLEAQAWTPRPNEFEAGELVGAVVHELSESARERIRFEVPTGLPFAFADFVQTARGLRHVVDNALIYSGGTVIIGAHSSGDGRLLVWVEDRGPGIIPREREQVFDKFYRGTAGLASTSSTGLGLSLTREILIANGGAIWIEDAEPCGARFVLELPTTEERTR